MNLLTLQTDSKEKVARKKPITPKEVDRHQEGHD
jgi:hypothetical protein